MSVDGEGAGHTPGRRGELKMIFAALLITALVGGAVVYYFLLGMPAYSLYTIRNAVRDGDRETFYRHFDARSVAERALARRLGVRAGEALAGPAERALRAAIDAKLGGPGRAQLAGMELESMERAGAETHVRLRGGSGPTTLVLEQMPDRMWKIVDVDLEAAGLGVGPSGP